MNIAKLPSGSYRIRQNYEGKTYSIVVPYKPSKKEAIELMADKMGESEVEPKSKAMTFQKAAEEYLKIKYNVLSPSTRRTYVTQLNTISEEFKGKYIKDITANDVQKEINDMCVERSPKYVRNVHSYISSILRVFKPNLILNTTLPQKVKYEPYIPIDDDIKKLFELSQNTMYEIPLLLACAGLRRSEICALEKSDLQGNILMINKALVLDENKEWVLKTTKTEESTRAVYVDDIVADKIRALPDGRIYHGHPNSVTDWIGNRLKELGIEHFSIHKLRHYYASKAHSIGIPDVYIMRNGGWRTDHIMKTVYRHALNDQEKEMQIKMSKITSSLMTN